MCARPVSSAPPGNQKHDYAELPSSLPSTPNISSSLIHPADRRQTTADLQRIYQESSESSTEVSLPDDDYGQLHQRQQISQRLSQKNTRLVDVGFFNYLNSLTPSSRRAPSSSTTANYLQLQSMQDQYQTLGNGPQATMASDQETISESSSVSTPSESEDANGLLFGLDGLEAAKLKLAALERSLAQLTAKSSMPDGVASVESGESDQESDPEIIGELKQQIAVLNNLVGRYATTISGEFQDTGLASKDANLTSMVRTVQAHRLDHAATRYPLPRPAANGNRVDLLQQHELSKSLSLRMPEEQSRADIIAIDIDTNDTAKLEALEREMQACAKRGDDAFTNYKRLGDAIVRDRESGDTPPHTLQAKLKKLQKFENEWLRCSKEIVTLIDQWESLVGQGASQADKPARQIASERNAFIDNYKGSETRALEKAHDALLKQLQDRVQENPAKVYGWDALAGAAGFSSSFLIGNTLARFLPGWAGVILPPVISGSFHVMVATPVVKNIMARTWNATSLAEFNNYMKLTGAQWGDRWAGEADIRKYASKDPARSDKLTIDERLAEEKDFSELSANRYRDEEAAYWAYTANYSLKAVLCGVFSQHFSTGTDAIKGIEAAMHGVMGALSGAEYSVGQQLARSTQPGAKATAVPTREVFAAQEEYLKSLRDDLDAALKAHRETYGSDPKDPTERALRKESLRIERERQAASAKARVAGMARHEFTAQFQGDAKWDTLSEVLGRILTLAPTTVTSYLTAHMRKSPDPVMMFLGHFLPSVTLIAPTGGFTSRPWICGLIRAGLQAFLTARDVQSKKSAQTVATLIPGQIRMREGQARPDAPDRTSTEVSSSELSSIEVSAVRTVDDHSTDHSFTVEFPDDSTSSDVSDEVWTGNPTQRDVDAAN